MLGTVCVVMVLLPSQIIMEEMLDQNNTSAWNAANVTVSCRMIELSLT
jgi:hypothetical protein